MSRKFDDLMKHIRALPTEGKAAILRELIDDLDPARDPDIERLWMEEAERRYGQYRRGEIEAISGDEAMARARKRLAEARKRPK